MSGHAVEFHLVETMLLLLQVFCINSTQASHKNVIYINMVKQYKCIFPLQRCPACWRRIMSEAQFKVFHSSHVILSWQLVAIMSGRGSVWTGHRIAYINTHPKRVCFAYFREKTTQRKKHVDINTLCWYLTEWESHSHMLVRLHSTVHSYSSHWKQDEHLVLILQFYLSVGA